MLVKKESLISQSAVEIHHYFTLTTTQGTHHTHRGGGKETERSKEAKKKSGGGVSPTITVTITMPKRLCVIDSTSNSDA